MNNQYCVTFPNGKKIKFKSFSFYNFNLLLNQKDFESYFIQLSQDQLHDILIELEKDLRLYFDAYSVPEPISRPRLQIRMTRTIFGKDWIFDPHLERHFEHVQLIDLYSRISEGIINNLTYYLIRKQQLPEQELSVMYRIKFLITKQAITNLKIIIEDLKIMFPLENDDIFNTILNKMVNLSLLQINGNEIIAEKYLDYFY